MTWDELVAHLRAAWPVARAGAGWVGLELRGDGPPLRVAVKRTVRDSVIVAAQVCPLGQIGAEEALRYSAAAELGALVLEGEAIFLRVMRELEGLGAAGVDALVAELAAEVARLRRAALPASVPLDVKRDVYAFMED